VWQWIWDSVQLWHEGWAAHVSMCRHDMHYIFVPYERWMLLTQSCEAWVLVTLWFPSCFAYRCNVFCAALGPPARLQA
jgi:hypothetical protein